MHLYWVLVDNMPALTLPLLRHYTLEHTILWALSSIPLQDPKDAMLRQFQDEIRSLREQLEVGTL